MVAASRQLCAKCASCRDCSTLHQPSTPISISPRPFPSIYIPIDPYQSAQARVTITGIVFPANRPGHPPAFPPDASRGAGPGSIPLRSCRGSRVSRRSRVAFPAAVWNHGEIEQQQQQQRHRGDPLSHHPLWPLYLSLSLPPRVAPTFRGFFPPSETLINHLHLPHLVYWPGKEYVRPGPSDRCAALILSR